MVAKLSSDEYANFSLVEMTHSELVDTDGGLIWFVVAGVALLAAACQGGTNNQQVVGHHNTTIVAPPGNSTIVANGDTIIIRNHR
ncbi:hypothetical protein VF13_39395 [Nostoc linckia z16]|nr:hypothetical protein VF12_37060 [Nostoc linckia z15]PHK30999.1 hypothetical protein VF13_39395 [Nostoc linckia z16]